MPESSFKSSEELEAYQKAVLDRYTYEFGDFRFCWVTRMVNWGDAQIKLTEVEADVLKILIDEWPMPSTTTNIVVKLGDVSYAGPADIKTWIKRLRKKLHSAVILSKVNSDVSYGYKFNAKGIMSREVTH